MLSPSFWPSIDLNIHSPNLCLCYCSLLDGFSSFTIFHLSFSLLLGTFKQYKSEYITLSSLTSSDSHYQERMLLNLVINQLGPGPKQFQSYFLPQSTVCSRYLPPFSVSVWIFLFLAYEFTFLFNIYIILLWVIAV